MAYESLQPLFASSKNNNINSIVLSKLQSFNDVKPFVHNESIKQSKSFHIFHLNVKFRQQLVCMITIKRLVVV